MRVKVQTGTARYTLKSIPKKIKMNKKGTVEELRSRYDAKLQHVFLTLSSGVFLQQCHN